MTRIVGVAKGYGRAMSWFYRKSPTMWPMRKALGALASPGSELPEGKLDISASAMAKIDAMNRYTAAQEGGGGSGVVKATKEVNAQVLADTKEKLASIRAMDYMTRQEKILNLREYMAAHAGTMAGVTDAEKLLNDELLALQQSRVDAMKVYAAELREDMQNAGLYVKEKFVEAARSIEGSMSSAFESMISEGASWRDAMSNFFSDVGNSFAKMASDMAARAVMYGIMKGIFRGGGDGGMITAGGSAAGGGNPYFLHGGGIAGIDGVRKAVPFGTFFGAPRFHLGSNEVPAILEKGEKVIPKGQSGGTVINNYINITAMDSQDVQRALAKEKNFLADLNYGAVKSNHPARRFER
jgi:hypothetical protein